MAAIHSLDSETVRISLMSQVVKLRRVSFRGVPAYLGEHQGSPVYSGNPQKVADWLCDGFRTRFNQHRSTRSRYVYSDGARVLDADGNPMLTPIGSNVVTLTDKQVREQFPHLAGIPSMVLQAPTRVEASEWFAAAKRRKTLGGNMPRFRSRKQGDRKFSCWFNGGTNAVFHQTGRRSGMVVIRGQNPPSVTRKGRWEIRFHVYVSQPIRSYTSVQVDLASNTVMFVSPAPSVDRSKAQGTVGIDRGVTHAAATSDGEFFDLPYTAVLDKRIRFLQKRMAKSRTVNPDTWKQGKRYAALRKRCSEAQRVRAAVKTDAIHSFTRRIAENYEVVVLEALRVKSMTKRAKKKNVSQKRGLNREIVNSRWSTMMAQLQYKTGSVQRADNEEPFVFAVDPSYTSQRCSSCGHIASENRESQSVFRCKSCGFTSNADINAAMNIAARHQQGWTGPARSKGQTVGASALSAPALKRKPPALNSS